MEDRDTILKHLAERKLHGCERTFANVYLWARFYNEGWAEIEGTAVFRTGQEVAYSYTYPIGAGDRKKVVEMLMEDAKEKGYPFQLHAVSKGEMEELESYFPGKFNVNGREIWRTMSMRPRSSSISPARNTMARKTI